MGLTIAIDFDGTCVTHEFPYIGADIGAVPVLKRLVENGHKLILFTMRSDIDNVRTKSTKIYKEPGAYLTAAIKWFRENDIPLYGIQTNPSQHTWTHSPKAAADLYIDDCGLGIPLMYNGAISKGPFVNWIEVEKLLEEKRILVK